MSNPDPVLKELDAEIQRLEVAILKLESDRQKALEMRGWWAARNQLVLQLGQAVETDEARPVEVVKGGPTLKELVLKVLEQHAEPLSAPRIRDEALKMGWRTKSEHKNPMVRNTLLQLIKDGEVERVGDHRYRPARPRRVQASPRWKVDTSPENGEEPEIEAQPTLPGPGG